MHRLGLDFNHRHGRASTGLGSRDRFCSRAGTSRVIAMATRHVVTGAAGGSAELRFAASVKVIRAHGVTPMG
jgi:hypothetical protein